MTQSTYPASMKAVAFDHFGGPEALHYVEVPSPSVRPNDLIVHVAAAGINRADINYREGRYGKEPNFGDSDLAGLDIAGTVVDVASWRLALLVDQPAPGTAILAVEGKGDQVSVSIWSYVYGAEGAAAAQGDEPRLAKWLSERALPIAEDHV